MWRGEKDAHQVNRERGAKSDRGGGKGRRSRMCRSTSCYPLREAARGEEEVRKRGSRGSAVIRRRVAEEEEEA